MKIPPTHVLRESVDVRRDVKWSSYGEVNYLGNPNVLAINILSRIHVISSSIIIIIRRYVERNISTNNREKIFRGDDAKDMGKEMCAHFEWNNKFLACMPNELSPRANTSLTSYFFCFPVLTEQKNEQLGAKRDSNHWSKTQFRRKLWFRAWTLTHHQMMASSWRGSPGTCSMVSRRKRWVCGLKS